MDKLKKNCHNCSHGGFESDGDYGEYTYFVCEKREDNGYNNLDNNLSKPSYLEKAKVCCDPMVEVKCKICGETEKASGESEDFLCFACWYQEEDKAPKGGE